MLLLDGRHTQNGLQLETTVRQINPRNVGYP